MAASTKTDGSVAVHHPRASAGFTEPLVAKQGSLFLLSTGAGDVHADTDQGLYFHDMRYISAETLRLNDSSPVSLLADASEGNHARYTQKLWIGAGLRSAAYPPGC